MHLARLKPQCISVQRLIHSGVRVGVVDFRPGDPIGTASFDAKLCGHLFADLERPEPSTHAGGEYLRHILFDNGTETFHLLEFTGCQQ